MLECRAVHRIRRRYVVVAAPLALLALLLATLPARGASSAKTVKVSVPASTMWMKTSVKLAAGESASITAAGTISYGSGDPKCQGIPITADGCAAETAAIAGPAGALVAKVGAGKPAVVGRSGTVTGPGTISLGINDYETEFGNNTGTFVVTITRGKAAKPALPDLPPATQSNARPVDAKSTTTGKSNYGGVTITRDGRSYRMTASSTLQTGDVISTDGETVLTIDFAIGGRTGLARNSSVRITGDRQIEGLRGTTMATPPSSLDHPLEIQTNGGILGVRG
ncbi:MAG TPA: LecA/PA-IL family lectin [Solirubrobacteraceae bacterium]|nr:LecA/PA-IL family lectin [Solirubrobacteraceae bacterium]